MFFVAIFLVLSLAILTCRYVQSAEIESTAANDHTEVSRKVPEQGFVIDKPRNRPNPMQVVNHRLLMLESTIAILSVGVLACVIAHKISRKRRVKAAIVIVLVLKLFVVLGCAIKIILN